ncbi:MAG: zf-HC2 domain-containing protein [Deltaproteobacteria bacterium]|nr:zf-HC2 domain-containing protein [Deltaproteobacteria bacterium]
MINPDEETIERILRHLLNKKQRSRERVGCPEEESLAGYLSGTLSENEREKIEVHLADCSSCLNEIVTVHKASQETMAEKVPQDLIERAMSLVRPARGPENFLDLVVRVVKGSLELVSTSGRPILAAAPVAVRGEKGPVESGVIEVEQGMERFKVGVEVEPVEPGLCRVVVSVTEEGRGVGESLRMSLFSGGRERASYLAREGKIAFDRIPRGEYNLAISDTGIPVGTIRLRLIE